MEIFEIEGLIATVFIPSLRDNKEPYEGYKTFAKWRNDIRVHAETDVFPTQLLAKRSPHTTEDEWKYITDNYKQVTMPLSVDYLSTVGRAWSDNNWAIDYKEDRDFQNYVEMEVKETPLKMSVEEYFKSVFPYVKLIDSMGCIVIKPSYIPLVEIDGELIVSGEEQFKPMPYYYSTEQVIAYEENEFFAFRMAENSVVEYQNKLQRVGAVYEIYDRNRIWKIVQVGKKIEWTFEIEEWHVHNADSIPVTRCKGIPKVFKNEIVWQSRFLAVKDLLDEVILDSVYLRGVKNICAFPYRVMTGNICQEKMEIEGEIQSCDGTGWFRNFNTGASISCPNCKGQGMQDRVSPYGVMLLKPETMENDLETRAQQPSMYYVSPKIDTPEFLRREIQQNYEHAKAILHLHTSSSDVKGNDDMTATGKYLDMKALYAFVKNDSDQTFATYEWALDWIGYMRFGERPDFNLTYPQSFDFYTDYDYLHHVSEAIKNGLPPFLVQATVMKYIKALWTTDIEVTHVYDLIMRSDRLMAMTDDEVLVKQSKGLVEDWEILLHDSGVYLVQDILKDDKNFLMLPLEEQKDILITSAKTAQALMPKKDTTTEIFLNADN